MEAQLQELLDTIQRDGVQAAERRAAEIIGVAERKAKDIVDKAEARQRAMHADGERQIERWRQSAERQLAQAGANLVIAVKQRIIGLFNRLVAADIDASISTKQLAEIVCAVIAEQIVASHGARRTEVSADPKRLAQIRDYAHKKLQAELTDKVSFTPLPDSEHEITLSFDDQHSGYRLSTADVRDAIQALLAPQLRALLNDGDEHSE